MPSSTDDAYSLLAHLERAGRSGEYVILYHDPATPEHDEAVGVFTEEEAVIKADEIRRDLDADGYSDIQIRVVPFQARERLGDPG